MLNEIDTNARRRALDGAGGAPPDYAGGSEGTSAGTSKDAPPAAKSCPTHDPAKDVIEVERTTRSAATHGAAIAERAIWNPVVTGTRAPKANGANAATRGRALEVLAGNNPVQGGLGRWAKDADRMTKNAVVQIKSTAVKDPAKVAQIARDATRDAARFIAENPARAAGRAPQAHIVVPTGTPKEVVDAARGALAAAKKPIPNALPPRVTTGLPGAIGVAGKALNVLGTVSSAVAFEESVERGDVAGAADAGTNFVAGALEMAAPVAPALGTAGVVAGVGVLSYDVTTAACELAMPDSVAVAYGGAIVHGLQAIGVDLEKE